MSRFRPFGIVYNNLSSAAWDMANRVAEHLGLGESDWIGPAEDLDAKATRGADTKLLITVGGDGTILRAVKLASTYDIPILGINMGRLGFMTELEGHDAMERLHHYLDSDAMDSPFRRSDGKEGVDGTPWIEARAMLQVQVVDEAGNPRPDIPAQHALNDAVIGRGVVSRVITVMASIDGAQLTTYRADAVIVSTATGSTGYNLSVGGPIIYPQAEVMVIAPVAPHLGLATGLVVPGNSVLQFTLESDVEALISVDGYLNVPLNREDRVRIEASPYKARFLRTHPPNRFFHTLTRRLDFGGAIPKPALSPDESATSQEP